LLYIVELLVEGWTDLCVEERIVDSSSSGIDQLFDLMDVSQLSVCKGDAYPPISARYVSDFLWTKAHNQRKERPKREKKEREREMGPQRNKGNHTTQHSTSKPQPMLTPAEKKSKRVIDNRAAAIRSREKKALELKNLRKENWMLHTLLSQIPEDIRAHILL
jgi:hypothetical protein